MVPPVWDFRPRDGGECFGRVGAQAARASFAMAGLTPDDVDVAELYDPFSFEIIRQLETFGFCPEGEGGAVRERRQHRPGWPAPRHHRWRHHVVQPRR